MMLRVNSWYRSADSSLGLVGFMVAILTQPPPKPSSFYCSENQSNAKRSFRDSPVPSRSHPCSKRCSVVPPFTSTQPDLPARAPTPSIHATDTSVRDLLWLETPGRPR